MARELIQCFFLTRTDVPQRYLTNRLAFKQDTIRYSFGAGVVMAATQFAPVELDERELADAQLDDIALAHEGEPWSAWKSAVVEWHVQTLARVRAESWIPGMAGEQDPMVERALSRFSSYHMRTTIARLREENAVLQRKLVEAVTCARFYAAGATDAGARARTALTALLAAEVMVTDTPASVRRSARRN